MKHCTESRMTREEVRLVLEVRSLQLLLASATFRLSKLRCEAFESDLAHRSRLERDPVATLGVILAHGLDVRNCFQSRRHLIDVLSAFSETRKNWFSSSHALVSSLRQQYLSSRAIVFSWFGVDRDPPLQPHHPSPYVATYAYLIDDSQKWTTKMSITIDAHLVDPSS